MTSLGDMPETNTIIPSTELVGCIQDISVPGIKLREEVRSSPGMPDSPGLQLEQLLLVSYSLA